MRFRRQSLESSRAKQVSSGGLSRKNRRAKYKAMAKINKGRKIVMYALRVKQLEVLALNGNCVKVIELMLE